MKPILFLLSTFFVTHCLAQSASFKEIKLKPNSKFYRSKEPTIIYPIITTHNSKADSLINSRVREELYFSGTENQSLKSVLQESIDDDGLIYMSYEVSYNHSGLLSFFISMEGCGAHCSTSYFYFNFDLTTGKSITIEDVILPDKIDSFRTIVQADKSNALSVYKTEEKKSILNGHIDSTSYEWILSYVDENCINNCSIDQFSVFNQSIEIFDPCELPFMLRSQTPDYKLKYDYYMLEPFLTPRFKKLLQ